MRLFVVDSIPLRTLSDHPDGPRPGDVVTFWRHAQDIDGTAADELRARGVTVEWAEGRIDAETAERIDEFVDHFGRNWHLRNGVDVTRSAGFSYGESVTRNLHGRSKINFLVRYGWIYEELFRAYPEVSDIVTDFIDGANWLTGGTPASHAFQRRQLLHDQARTRGILCRGLEVKAPIPAVGFHGREPVYRHMIRSFIGGFRPRYLLGRLQLRFMKKKSFRIYVFMTAGLGRVAEALGRRTEVECVADWTGYTDVIPLRYDHLLAFPSMNCLRAVRKLHHVVREIKETGFDGDLARFGPIDFTPYFRASIEHLVPHHTIPALIAAAQARKMLKVCRPDLVVINGEGSIIARLVVGLERLFGYQIAFIDHSHTLVNYGPHPCGRNFPNVIYIAQGSDHVKCYGRKLSADRKPWRPVLTNPNSTAMDEVRGRRRKPSGKSILLTNYSGAPMSTVARMANEDKFLIDLLEAARTLVPEDYKFTYRPHPGYTNSAYLDYVLNQTNMAEYIQVDDVKDFPESLMNHDLVVVNVSGCFYQALYAGWPTIFYEPDFDPHQFVGLPAATDIERPIASTPEQLVQMIREGINQPDSLTARFPKMFNTVYAHRFIGRDADQADEVLAAFLVEEVLGGHSPTGPTQGTIQPEIAAE